MAARIEMKLSVGVQLASRRIGTHGTLDLQVGPVDLRGVPPMRLGVAIGRGLTLVGGGVPVIRQCEQDGHVGRGPVIAGLKRQVMGLSRSMHTAIGEHVRLTRLRTANVATDESVYASRRRA